MSSFQFSTTPQEVKRVKTKYREIKTAIPAPGTENILAKLEKYESRSMQGQIPIVWDRAVDFNVFDIAGNKWIDFTSTIFVANVGHSNSKVNMAIEQAIGRRLYSCYTYANKTRVEYLERLIEFSEPYFEKAFLLSAGTEATDAALKLMRMQGQKIKKRRRGIICIENNWHGRTLGAQMMGSNLSQKDWIGFKDPDIHHIPFPYPWCCDEKGAESFLHASLNELEATGVNLKTDICGFMLETFQGWGAVFYPNAYVRAIEKFCKSHGILFAFDEMQAGFGRTGRRFGFEHYNVNPDLICVGKGMGGGVPLSGIIGKSEIMDLPDIGNMSSTHSANPLVCAAGLAVLDELIARELVPKASALGEKLNKALMNVQGRFPLRISHVLGKGMIMALLFREKDTGKPDPFFASRVVERCLQKGVLVVHTGRESIKLGPPLTITEEALLEGVNVIEESIEEISQE